VQIRAEIRAITGTGRVAFSDTVVVVIIIIVLLVSG
jgi:hypothetical protein